MDIANTHPEFNSGPSIEVFANSTCWKDNLQT